MVLTVVENQGASVATNIPELVDELKVEVEKTGFKSSFCLGKMVF